MLDRTRSFATKMGRLSALALATGIVVTLGACGGPEETPELRSSASIARADERPPAIQPATTGDDEPSLQRRLSALLSSLGSDHPGTADGYLADGESLSPYGVEHPALANLDAALLEAVQAAARDASLDGVEIRISSGWRSLAYQEFLLREAIQLYGNTEEARRFVNTPELSTHTSGDAVDIAPMDAMSWLSQHGSAYGLCQTYANELWHYELMAEPGGTCPPQLSDASD